MLYCSLRIMRKSLPTLCCAIVAVNAISKQDYRPSSKSPPDGLKIEQAPMFVSIGFDDNAYSGLSGSGGEGGMAWATDFFRHLRNPCGTGNPRTHDGAPVRASFYATTTYIENWHSESPTYVKRSWRMAYEDGHEFGSHTHTNPDGTLLNEVQWRNEIEANLQWLTKPFNRREREYDPGNDFGVGIPIEEVTGFRAPYLSYNADTFKAIQARGNFVYDNSIEDGWNQQEDGTNYAWPYTLHDGSPGHDYMVENGFPNQVPLSKYPGLWEVPIHPVIVPPDAEATRYGFSPGLRNRVKSVMPWFSAESGKLTGFDYNLWTNAKMNKVEVLATLKYTLDLRLRGNRAPFTFGAHTDTYNTKWVGDVNAKANTSERQEALEEFILYALSKPEVRVVPPQATVEWMRDSNRGIYDSEEGSIDDDACLQLDLPRSGEFDTGVIDISYGGDDSGNVAFVESRAFGVLLLFLLFFIPLICGLMMLYSTLAVHKRPSKPKIIDQGNVLSSRSQMTYTEANQTPIVTKTFSSLSKGAFERVGGKNPSFFESDDRSAALDSAKSFGAPMPPFPTTEIYSTRSQSRYETVLGEEEEEETPPLYEQRVGIKLKPSFGEWRFFKTHILPSESSERIETHWGNKAPSHSRPTP